MPDKLGEFFKYLDQKEFFGNEYHTEVHTPKQEIPACTVPKAGEEPNNEDVSQLL